MGWGWSCRVGMGLVMKSTGWGGMGPMKSSVGWGGSMQFNVI